MDPSEPTGAAMVLAQEATEKYRFPRISVSVSEWCILKMSHLENYTIKMDAAQTESPTKVSARITSERVS